MKITSRLTRRQAGYTVGVGAVFFALIGALLGAPAIASADPNPAVLDLINQQRTQAGCKPLNQNPQLMAAADRHAKDLATPGTAFSHSGSDGSTMAQRAEAAGYNWGAIGEIITPGNSPQDAISGWLSSPPHKASMLNCDKWIDGGAASSGGNYVAMFGTPLR
jgi:uncharacterized protein YkwD